MLRSRAAVIAALIASRIEDASMLAMAAAVVPLGDVTFARSTAGSSSDAANNSPAPRIVFTVITRASAADRPISMPAAIIASAR